MLLNGNLSVIGQIKDLKPENLVEDPLNGDLVASRLWFNSVEARLKFYDGTEVHTLAVGGSLNDYVKHDGTVAMTGELKLNNTDQSASASNVAISKGHLDAVASTKQNNITGAATTIVSNDLAVSMGVVSDSSGKVGVSTATAAEVAYLSGVTSAIQTQIDSKEDNIGYVPLNKAGDNMTGNLTMGGSDIIGLPAPSDATSPVRKADLEAWSVGNDFQADVLAVQEDGTLNPGTPSLEDRYILNDVSTAHANFGDVSAASDGDIVEWDGDSFEVVYDVSVELEGALLWNRDADIFLRLNAGEWAEFGGLSGVTAGVALVKSGNTINVQLGAGVAQLPTDEVGIDAKSDGGLFNTIDGTTVSTDTASQLSIKLDGSSVQTTSLGLSVASNGITEAMLNGSIIGNGLQGAAGTAMSVKTAAGSGITVDTNGVSVDDVEMRTRTIFRDGAQAMTGELTLNSADQSASSALVAASVGYVNSLAGSSTQDIADLETRMEAGLYVYDGTASPALAHTVTHNLGNTYASVTIVDAADEVIVPDTITYSDTNSLIVTFSESIGCRVVVMGLKAS
jgi:hypothetical protein